ncbi:hypothetical protein HELRODRAFT_181040 [Helobdella robusta]|uniref:Uncharacterized protein n=1 Tax=Helobdella robusta TaxID=6412 RepID=T1FGJ9_HELRO|nr:hypothetical protein HELRODRAFT_181040 [Helobdella robusta]ESN93294.1 hypothetical protein HELRODRAFT_181040 [Helobdella robusta]
MAIPDEFLYKFYYGLPAFLLILNIEKQIKFRFVSFRMRVGVCTIFLEALTLKDGNNTDRKLTLCSNDFRINHVMVTNSNRVVIHVNRNVALTRLAILHFEVIGCGLPILPTHQTTPLKFDWLGPDKVTVKCPNTTQIWSLICINNKWVGGNIGDCYPSNHPDATMSLGKESLMSSTGNKHVDDVISFGLLFAVSIGVGVGVVLGGILLFLATKYFKKFKGSQNRSAGYIQPREQYVCLGNKHPPTSFTSTNHNTRAGSSANQSKVHRPTSLSQWCSIDSHISTANKSCESELSQEPICRFPTNQTISSSINWPLIVSETTPMHERNDVIGCCKMTTSFNQPIETITCPECNLVRNPVINSTNLN